MRYFTDKLWDELNSQIPELKEEAKKHWVRNIDDYFQRFDLLKNRLSKNVYHFFKTDFLHDFNLLTLEIVHGRIGIKNPVGVILVVCNGNETWKIIYKKVKKVSINYENENIRITERRGFDSWGYDELLDVDQDTLSHEILFASGATVLVHFANKNIFLMNMVSKTD